MGRAGEPRRAGRPGAWNAGRGCPATAPRTAPDDVSGGSTATTSGTRPGPTSCSGIGTPAASADSGGARESSMSTTSSRSRSAARPSSTRTFRRSADPAIGRRRAGFCGRRALPPRGTTVVPGPTQGAARSVSAGRGRDPDRALELLDRERKPGAREVEEYGLARSEIPSRPKPGKGRVRRGGLR